MRRILKLAIPLILLTVAACETTPEVGSTGLGPIICPQSLLAVEEAPSEIDPNFVSRLSREDQVYITQRESWWETVLASAEAAKTDALQACADYNRRVNALQSGGNLGG